jgi:hypothetical protein
MKRAEEARLLQQIATSRNPHTKVAGLVEAMRARGQLMALGTQTTVHAPRIGNVLRAIPGHPNVTLLPMQCMIMLLKKVPALHLASTTKCLPAVARTAIASRIWSLPTHHRELIQILRVQSPLIVHHPVAQPVSMLITQQLIGNLNVLSQQIMHHLVAEPVPVCHHQASKPLLLGLLTTETANQAPEQHTSAATAALPKAPRTRAGT